MKIFRTLFLLSAAQITFISAVHAQSDSTRFRQISVSVDEEQSLIASQFKNSYSDFQSKVDFIQEDIAQKNLLWAEKNNQLNKILRFLQNINKEKREDYFENGRNESVISFFPALMDHAESGDVDSFLIRNHEIALKSLVFFAGEPYATSFVINEVKENPEAVLREFSFFFNQPYKREVVEIATELAPSIAQRYMANPSNKIAQLISSSKDSVCITLQNIYDETGYNSRACLLLDDIYHQRLSIHQADSLSENDDWLFVNLVKTLYRNDHLGDISIKQELEFLSVSIIREINQQQLNGRTDQSFFAIDQFNAQELFVLFSYGFKEFSKTTFYGLFERIQNKNANQFSAELFTLLDEDHLTSLLSLCAAYDKLEEFFALTDKTIEDDLLQLMASSEDDESAEDFESYFIKKKIVHQNLDLVDVNFELPENNPDESIKKIEAVITVLPKEINNADPVEVVTVNNEIEIPVEEFVEPVHIELAEAEKDILHLKRDIRSTISNTLALRNGDISKDFLQYAMTKNPDEVLKNAERFWNQPFAEEIIVNAAKHAPVQVKKYLPVESHWVNKLLLRSNDSVVHTLFQIEEEAGPWAKSYILLDDLVNHRLTIARAEEICNDDQLLFRQLIKLASSGNYLGQYSVDQELRDRSLRFIREINALDGKDELTRFASVADFKPDELYTIIIYGQEEIFTSSFKGLFDRMLQRMNGTGDQLFAEVGNNKFRTFIKMCAEFNRLNDFLSSFSSAGKENLIEQFISGLEKNNDDLSEVIEVAETICCMADLNLLNAIEKNLKTEYERVSASGDKKGMAIYGLLAAMLNDKPVDDKHWAWKISRQFGLPELAMIPNEELFNESGTNVQMQFFYDDDDGAKSFSNFINTYKNDANWKIDDRQNYLVLSSVSGKDIEIYTNRAEFEISGQDAILEYFSENNLSPTVVVHRGHSFYTNKTLDRVPTGTKILLLGSCGAYHLLTDICERMPELYIVASKQIGTMSVNDPVFKMLNEDIRMGKDINWQDLWQRAEAKVGSNPYFDDYVAPHENIGSLFVQAYYKLLGVL